MIGHIAFSPCGPNTVTDQETFLIHRVADIIRSCLGPKAMLKMLLDPMGGIVLTNDGHAILREIEVSHPAAKSMIELSRTQDEEVGDGTTTVIILGMHTILRPLRRIAPQNPLTDRL